MAEIDQRVRSALCVQLAEWRAALANGAERVGWKLGMGDRERIGRGPVIGHLTSASRLEDGTAYLAGRGPLHADAEVALEIARDVPADADEDEARRAISGYGAALELVDLSEPPITADAIVAANVFHRAFVMTPSRPELPRGVEGRLIVNGDLRASAPAPSDLADRVLVVARLLGAMGERLRAGDRIITGSIVQVPVEPGDEVVADLGALGRPRATLAA